MKKRLIAIAILIAYSAILIKIMVFKDVPVIRVGSVTLNFGGTDADGPANFWPFKTIVPYLLGDKGWLIAGLNLVGNIVLLVPIGFLAPLIYRNLTWKRSLSLGVAAGLTIEVMQTVLHVGIFDIDDVILNALGVMIGYWAFEILVKWVSLRKYKNIFLTTITVIAVVTIAFYAVYPRYQPLILNAEVGAGGVQSDGFNSREGEVP